MSEKKKSITWEVTPLTPLHVGDGENLIQGMDYVLSKNALAVYSLDTVLRSIADNPRAVSDLGRTKLDAFMKRYQIDIPADYTLPVSGFPREMRRFIKNAYGEPYLTGSALKGAIRTALWTTLDRSRLPSSNNFDIFKKRVKNLGGNPHNDFLRPLTISDSPGFSAEGVMRAEEIKFFNIQTGDRAGWKDFSKKSLTVNHFQDAAGIYVEAVKPGTRMMVRAELDPFLLSKTGKAIWPIPQGRGLDDFNALAQTINEYSRNMASRELEFFMQFGNATAGVSVFYQDLIQNGFKAVADITGGFILRMAWGSGWRGMTGDWLRDKDLEDLRSVKRLGKNGVPIFPKTRRLAMLDGVPSRPLGWVFIQPAKGDILKVSSVPDAAPPPVSTVAKPEQQAAPADSEPKPEKTSKPPEQIQKEILEQFTQLVNACANLPGEIDSFLQKMEAQESAETQKKMLQILLEKGQSLGKKKKFAKALKDGKPWAEKLEAALKAHDMG